MNDLEVEAILKTAVYVKPSHVHRKTTIKTSLKFTITKNKMVGTNGTFRSFAYLGSSTSNEDAKRSIYREYKEYNTKLERLRV